MSLSAWGVVCGRKFPSVFFVALHPTHVFAYQCNNNPLVGNGKQLQFMGRRFKRPPVIIWQILRLLLPKWPFILLTRGFKQIQILIACVVAIISNLPYNLCSPIDLAKIFPCIELYPKLHCFLFPKKLAIVFLCLYSTCWMQSWPILP